MLLSPLDREITPKQSGPLHVLEPLLVQQLPVEQHCLKKTRNNQQVLSQDNILQGFGLSPLFPFLFFFFDLPPKKERKGTSACLFRYSFIYICLPLDCSFHTVMRLLANGKIQRGDPLFFSFMISPGNIFLHASETFRLCIKKKYKKGKKKKRKLQLALTMLSPRHPPPPPARSRPALSATPAV